MIKEYPEWVPEVWIEAETLWEKANALEIFDQQDVDCECGFSRRENHDCCTFSGEGPKFIVGGYLTDTIQDVMVKDYPVAGHDLTKVEAMFGPYDVGQLTLQVTWDNEAEEIKSASLHEARREDMKWKCKPDDIQIAGVDDTEQRSEGATNIGRRDNPYGQTD